MGSVIVAIDTATLEIALDALLVRVRWYVTRGYRIPASVAVAFNELADLTRKPHALPWTRIV